MPKDYKSFVLVAAHLVKNAHRYYDVDCKEEGVKADVEIGTTGTTEENRKCKELNKLLQEISSLKRKNCIKEQQLNVNKLKEAFGSYRSISQLSGIPLKTVHFWCAEPKRKNAQRK